MTCPYISDTDLEKIIERVLELTTEHKEEQERYLTRYLRDIIRSLYEGQPKKHGITLPQLVITVLKELKFPTPETRPT